MSSQNSDSVSSSFPNWIPLISFVGLIAVARTSSSVLNNSGENGHSCLVLDFSWKAFSFSTLNSIFVVGLVCHNWI